MAVSILLARALVEAVEAANVDRHDFLTSARFDPERLDQVDGRMDLAEWDALIGRALDATGDPALALHMFENPAIAATYNITAHLVMQATCFRAAIETILQYHRLINDRPYWVVSEEEHTATIRYAGEPGPLRCRRFRAEFTVTAMCKMVQYFARMALPLVVAFDYPEPSYRKEYAAAFQGRERFAQPFTGIVFPRALLDATHMNGDVEFHSTLKAQAAKRVAKLDRDTTYAERVREYVSANPGRQDMPSVARALGVSARSLRRRLSEEGTLYNVVVDRAIASVAIRLLLDEQRSIQEVSHELSFSDASTFCRAFKRWTGATPKQFLATHAQGPRTIRLDSEQGPPS
jgi:AraC-like DNA-binding protein